ncbi:MAG: hypothetical protein IJ304_03990, partial [Clostridia bacterium]|nr:hypothetical protein [Clostridia bacterium]
MNKKRKFGMISIIALILVCIMSVNVFAATTNTILDGKISITDTTGTGSGSASSYAITVSANFWQTKSNTITITNESGKDGTLSFGYSVSNSSAFTIGGASASTSGSYSNTILAGGTISIGLSVKATGMGTKKATFTMTDITFEEMAESSSIVYEFDSSLGSVTAGGTAISSGSTVDVGADGVAMVATPASGAVFVGWINEANEIVSKTASFTQMPIGDGTIRALFSNGTPYFSVDDKYIYSDLNTAASKGTKVVLMCNGTLAAGNYTIPSGVTLLIPMDSLNTVYTNVPPSKQMTNNTYVAGTLYRKLTLASGANITVNGAISISGKLSASQGSHGSLVDTYGQIAMNSGSTITVNSGAKLYSWGFITGSGSVTAKSGATVYEPFQVADWRGGDATSSMMDNDKRVFPMSQYYVQNIEVPLTLEAGATENGFMAVYVTVVGIQTSEVPFIGSTGMFNITSGYVIKDYDENTDRLVIDAHGGITMQSLELSMKLGILGTSTLKSENYSLPINGNITLNAHSGTTLNVTQDMALLPGAEINVYSDATCTFANGSTAYIYDSTEWGPYCSHTNQVFVPAKLVPGRKYTRTQADLKDAVVYIEGVVDASAGFVYTTESGANICGAEGGIAKLQQGTNTVTYQVTQTSGDITGWPEIPVTTAWLKNADGTYVDPEVLGNCCSTYVYTNGVWTPNPIVHTNEETVAGTPATCTTAGLTDGKTCTACGTVIQAQTTIPATGHTYGDWSKVDDTNHSKTCSGCGDVVTAAHAWDAGVVTTPATCTVDGVKTYTCSDCSHTKTETIPATGHSYGDWQKDDANNHKKVCSCGDVVTEAHTWNAGVITTDATCTVDGVKTYTCTVCSETKTETIKASGHTYGDWEKDDAENHKKVCSCGDTVTEVHAWNDGVITTQPTHTVDGVKTYTCTVCSETKTEAIPAVGHSHGDWEAADDTNHKKTCSCGNEITEAHAWDDGVVTTPATHFVTGVKTFTCSTCGHTKTEVIDIIPHSYGDWEADGDNHKKVCSCGDTVTEAHGWDAGSVTTQPTHTADGEKIYTCSTCGHTKTEVIPAIGHSYSDWEAGEDGKHIKSCSCGDVVTEDHKWNDGEETTAPTHVDDGVKTFTCTVCSHTYTEAIPAVGHSHGDWEKDDAENHKK